MILEAVQTGLRLLGLTGKLVGARTPANRFECGATTAFLPLDTWTANGWRFVVVFDWFAAWHGIEVPRQAAVLTARAQRGRAWDDPLSVQRAEQAARGDVTPAEVKAAACPILAIYAWPDGVQQGVAQLAAAGELYRWDADASTWREVDVRTVLEWAGVADWRTLPPHWQRFLAEVTG